MKNHKSVHSLDDFQPSMGGGMVEVSITKRDIVDSRPWLVGVCGDGSFGLERYNLTLDEALRLYMSIEDGITIEKLKSLGFSEP